MKATKTQRPRHARIVVEDAPTFEDVVLPHLDAAYRVARVHMRNAQDADDVVQEATLRALRYFATFAGGNARGWFLTIVRHVCSDLRDRRGRDYAEPFDEARHSRPSERDAETSLLRADVERLIHHAMAHLPPALREVLLLREIHELSYREVAEVMGLPDGTVMSRLWRARAAVRSALAERMTA